VKKDVIEKALELTAELLRIFEQEPQRSDLLYNWQSPLFLTARFTKYMLQVLRDREPDLRESICLEKQVQDILGIIEENSYSIRERLRSF